MSGRQYPELWGKVHRVDLWGSFACARAAARRMKRGGAIVNVGSIPALTGDADGLVCDKDTYRGTAEPMRGWPHPRVRVG